MPNQQPFPPTRAPQTATAKAATDNGQRWGRIPAWWLDHPDLDADGLAVLAALSTYADEAGVCWPSQTTLAAKLKRSRPTVNRLIGRLEAMGLVTVEHRNAANGGRLSCRYRLRLSADEANEPSASVSPGDALIHKPTPLDSWLNAPCSSLSHEQLQTKQIPDSLSERTPVTDGSTAEGQNDRHGVSDHWSPSAGDRAWAATRFPDVDLDRHAELFRQRCQAHGYRYKDVGAAWRSWLLQDFAGRTTAAAQTITRNGPPRPPAAAATVRTDSVEQRLNAWSSVAARLSAVSSPSSGTRA
ncbi:helix-turn-helix domain-containing protein [Azospirillum griseum]|uniref:Helix-turn-helix domain-containing protein n=1 Tax=Azospirillum griseum TaxID=2496639 RepID=A0A431VKN4_9PROT|nr:helix-turn-helix domain-containing protein [Azospirillum griseum]RTR22994.1 helix-turn-helix domain-containing protein [Azospirillum griseum]